MAKPQLASNGKIQLTTRKEKTNVNGNVQTTTVEKQIRRATEGQLDELRLSVERSVNKLRGRLAFDEATEWGKNSQALDRVIERLLLPPPSSTDYTQMIFETETFILDAVDNDQTIERAKRVFKGYLDWRFVKGLNTDSALIKPTNAGVHRVIKDGKFELYFNSFSRHLDSLCLLRARIIQFCDEHRNRLSNNGCGTFFLYKDGEDYLVARVSFYPTEDLHLNVYNLAYAGDWGSFDRHSVVIAQQEPVVV